MSVPSSRPDFAQGEATKVATRIAILGPVSAQIAFVLELTLVPVLLPSIQAEFGLSLLETAWVFNAYSTAMAVGIIACAVGGDSFKSSKVFSFGVVLFLAGSILIYLAVSNPTLIVGRICQGLGAGMFSPLIPVLLTQAVPDRPGRALILWGSTAGYIAAFAPFAYGTMLSDENWSLAFLCIAIVAGVSLLLIGTLQTPEDPTPANEQSASYSQLFKTRELWLTFAYVFATYGAITLYLFRVPLFLAESGAVTSEIGVVLSVFWLSFSGMSALLRNSVDNHHIRLIMVSAPMLIAVGLMLAFSANLALVVLSACLVGCGLACSNAPSTQMVLKFAPRGLGALATSIDISAARLGGIVAVTALAEVSLRISAGTILVFCCLAAVCAYVFASIGAKGP
jgi:predicted MFS family arabinose efflux permease